MCDSCQQFVRALKASESECEALRAQLRAVSQVLYGLADVIDPWVGAVEMPHELEECVS